MPIGTIEVSTFIYKYFGYTFFTRLLISTTRNILGYFLCSATSKYIYLIDSCTKKSHQPKY